MWEKVISFVFSSPTDENHQLGPEAVGKAQSPG